MIVTGKNGLIDISKCEPHELKSIGRESFKNLSEDDFFSFSSNFEYPLSDKHKEIIVNETVIPKYTDLQTVPDNWRKDEEYKIVSPYIKVEPYKNIIPNYGEYHYFLKKKGISTIEDEAALVGDFLKYTLTLNEDEVQKHIELIYRKLIFIRDAFNASYGNHFIKYYTVNFQKDANHSIRNPLLIKSILDELDKDLKPYKPPVKYAVINPSLNISPYQAREIQDEARECYLEQKTYKAYLYHRNNNIPHTAKNYAEYLNVSDPTARKYMEKKGIAIENDNELVSSDNQARIKKLKERGFKRSQIHKETGISRVTINKYWDNV